MTAIVYDYPAIAKALRRDDWFARVVKIEPPPFYRPSIGLVEEMLKDRREIEEITGMDSLPPEPLDRTRLPEIRWRLLSQGKPIT